MYSMRTVPGRLLQGILDMMQGLTRSQPCFVFFFFPAADDIHDSLSRPQNYNWKANLHYRHSTLF